MPLPTNDLAFILQDAGVACTATISSVLTSFYGIFNADTRIEQDESGMEVVIVGTSLTVTTALADTLAKNTRISVAGVNYQIRDKMLTGDGALTQLIIARV